MSKLENPFKSGFLEAICQRTGHNFEKGLFGRTCTRCGKFEQ